MSSSDESHPILTLDAHTSLVERHDTLTKDLRMRGGVKDKGTSITDQATLDQEERDRQVKKDDLRALKEILNNPLVVQPGENLSLAVSPCFVTLIMRVGDGPKSEIQRLLYDPPSGMSTAGCNGYALRSDSPIGGAIKGQPVGFTQTISVNGGEQKVTITKVQALKEVETEKK